ADVRSSSSQFREPSAPSGNCFAWSRSDEPCALTRGQSRYFTVLLGLDSCIARGAGRLQAGQIVVPPLLLVSSQVIEDFPGIDAGVVSVGKAGPHGIVPDGFQRFDIDLALAGLQNLLADAVPAHFGRWAVDAEQFEGQAKLLSRAEGDFEHARALVQYQLGRDGGVFAQACHESSLYCMPMPARMPAGRRMVADARMRGTL